MKVRGKREGRKREKRRKGGKGKDRSGVSLLEKEYADISCSCQFCE